MSQQTIGSYRLDRSLGAGDVGEVFAAQHQFLPGWAAVKILREPFAQIADVADCFLNELPAVERVKHRAIVHMIEQERVTDGAVYVARRYVEGETLTAYLQRRGGKLPIAEVLAISRQISSALDAAHSAGLPHGGLHPNNVLVSPDPEMDRQPVVQIVDFGIARVVAAYLRAGNAPLARTTPACDYLAPEQRLIASKVDFPADVYTLGLLIHVMAAGSLPAQPVPALPQAIPLDLAQILRRMLDESPAARPRMAEIASALAQPVLGDFLVEATLVRDGHTALYQVYHPPTKQRGLLRVLHSADSEDPLKAAHFLATADALQQMPGGGFVQIYDQGTLPNKNAYAFLEELQGESLSDRLKRVGRLGPAALGLAQQMAATLARAHAGGIAYLGLHPGKVILTAPEGGAERARILDSATVQISGDVNPADGGQVADVQIAGPTAPALYLAPEQCAAEQPADARADVYALGAVLYQMLSGHPPFNAQGRRLSDLVALQQHRPRPLDKWNPAISKEVAELVVERMLARDPAARPSMAEVERSLKWLILLDGLLKGPPLVGQHGKYKIARSLDPSGFAAMFEANDENGIRVAIKVPLPQCSKEGLERERTVFLALKDGDPGFIRLLDWAALPDGTPFMVVEYTPGDLLPERRNQWGGQLRERDVVRLGAQIASALAAAHGAKVVHGALTPDDIVLVPDPQAVPGGERAKICNFGSDRLAAEYQAATGQPLVRAGVEVIQQQFQPPEQRRTSTGLITEKTDVYSLGALLYWMLGGVVPADFPLSEVASAALLGYLNRMLADDPDFRPTMAQVAVEIERLKPPVDPAWRRLALATVLGGGCLVGTVAGVSRLIDWISPVEWTVISDPAGATLRDEAGKAFDKTPWKARAKDLNPASGQMKLQVELPGYQRQWVTFDVKVSSPKKPLILEPAVWSITSDPDRADVLDESGKVVSKTPFHEDLANDKVTGLQRTLKVAMDRYVPQELTLDTCANEKQIVKLKPRRWKITSEPAGAMVVLDQSKASLGLTPLDVDTPSLPGNTASKHVLVKLDGYAPADLWLDPKKDEQPGKLVLVALQQKPPDPAPEPKKNDHHTVVVHACNKSCCPGHGRNCCPSPHCPPPLD